MSLIVHFNDPLLETLALIRLEMVSLRIAKLKLRNDKTACFFR